MHPSPTLELKLEAASKAGFQGVEIGFDDLVSHADRHNPGFKGEEDLPTLLKSASEISRDLCSKLHLEIICLQPFQDFEGATETKEREARFAKAKKYLAIMNNLGTTMLQVGSTDNTSTSGDKELRVIWPSCAILQRRRIRHVKSLTSHGVGAHI